MGATAKGFAAIAIAPQGFEPRQVLLPETPITAAMSLINQPSIVSASAQMHLHIVIKGATAPGTVSLAGKKADGTTVVTSTTPTLPAATTDKPNADYGTPETYGSVNASGISITGLTNGTITIYGILAATKLIPIDFDTAVKFDQFSPKDHRGINYRHFRQQQLNKHVTMNKFESGFYPETDLWWPHAALSNAPTVSTLPGTPDVLLAATLVTASPISLTTQPKAPGELLQIVVTGATAPGTVQLTGVDQRGVAATEIVNCSGNGTFYSQKVYSAMNASGVVVAGLTGGSVAIGGFFATKWVFLFPSSPLAALAMGVFTGTESGAYPYVFFQEGVLDMDVMKEIKLSAKPIMQDHVILGDRTTANMNASRLPTFGQPYDDPLVGWPAVIYIDPISGTPFSTQYNDLLTCKITVVTGLKDTNTATNKQQFDRVYQDMPEVKFEASVDFTNVQQFEQYRQNQKQIFGVRFQDTAHFLGNIAGSILYKYWQWTLPAKYNVYDEDRSKEMVQAKISGICEYEPSLGYAARLEIVNQAPPNYATT